MVPKRRRGTKDRRKSIFGRASTKGKVGKIRRVLSCAGLHRSTGRRPCGSSRRVTMRGGFDRALFRFKFIRCTHLTPDNGKYPACVRSTRDTLTVAIHTGSKRSFGRRKTRKIGRNSLRNCWCLRICTQPSSKTITHGHYRKTSFR